MKKEEIEAKVGAMEAVMALLIGDLVERDAKRMPLVAQTLVVLSADKSAHFQREIAKWAEMLMQAHPTRAKSAAKKPRA